MSKESDLYYTPQNYIDSVYEVLGYIELDPTSSLLANETIKANRIFTIDNSMFDNELKCNTLYFNPPYSNPLPFVRKIIESYNNGDIKEIIGVLNFDCSTKWFQELSTINNHQFILFII